VVWRPACSWHEIRPDAANFSGTRLFPNLSLGCLEESTAPHGEPSSVLCKARFHSKSHTAMIP
jgi:hypothetical protein